MTKTHLPIIGSTAATTAFVHAEIEGLDGRLYVDGNQKITASNGDYDAPRPNAFSLLAASVEGREESCPGSTPTCRKSCYVRDLAKHQPDLYALYLHNSIRMPEILSDRHLADDWAMRMAAWISVYASGGFRWHVSGDVYSRAYAEWIADVCRESPTVRHWIYTRSFDHLGPLVEVATFRGGNLALNLSADKDNYAAARVARFAYATDEDAAPRICYLVEALDPRVPADLPPGSTIFPDYDLRPRGVEDPTKHPWWASLTAREHAMCCPVDSFGKSEKRRCGFVNACDRCLT